MARLLFAEGNFVRRKVDLQGFFGEPFQITDIDVLSIEYTDTLERRIIVGECKTTEAKSAPNATDRLLWNNGLQRLIGADGGFVATTKVASPRVRQLARGLGSTVMDPSDLDRRETLMRIDNGDFSGSHHPDLVLLQRRVRDATKTDDQLRRIYTFVCFEFWLSPPAAGLKRALAAARTAARFWSPRLPHEDRETIEWLVQQSVIAMTVAITTLAGECYRQPQRSFEDAFRERLAEGVAPYRALEEMSRMVDEFVMGVLSEAGVDPASQVDSLGAFAPTVPPYADTLLEVIVRFASVPQAARDVPRLLDWRAAAFARRIETQEERLLFEDNPDTHRLVRTIRTFLVGQGLRPELLEFVEFGRSSADALAGGVVEGKGRDGKQVDQLGLVREDGPEDPPAQSGTKQ